jgi:acyl-CoA dehydrogenase
MNDVADALTEAVTDACRRHPSAGPADGDDWNAALWSALEEIGIGLLSVPDERGGSGGDLLTAAAVLQVLGRHAARVPFVETALQAAWLLASCHAPIPPGPMTAAVAGPGLRLHQQSSDWVLHGDLDRVPWARCATRLVVLIGREVVTIPREGFDVHRGTNLAGEPRDRVIINRLPIPGDRIWTLPEGSDADADSFAARGALGRLALTAGAARGALELSVAYASEREQFGRSLHKFQAVQQQLAALAGETLLCRVAAESAALALDGPTSSRVAITAARVAAAEAAGRVASIAHQIHGAIGFTEEHDLRRSTTRLWSWRDECGSVKEWASRLGDLSMAAGADGLWPLISEGSLHDLAS